MRCTCLDQVFQEDMGLSENKLIKAKDQITFNIVVFPEISSNNTAPTKYRVFLKQVLLDEAEGCIIELKNSSLSIDSNSLRHLKQSVAVLVWRELGRMYKEMDVRALPLMESFAMQRAMFGNNYRMQLLVCKTFECSAIDYLEEFNIKQIYQTAKRQYEREANQHAQFRPIPPVLAQPQFHLVFPTVQQVPMLYSQPFGQGASNPGYMNTVNSFAIESRSKDAVSNGLKVKNYRGSQKKMKKKVHDFDSHQQYQSFVPHPNSLPVFSEEASGILFNDFQHVYGSSAREDSAPGGVLQMNSTLHATLNSGSDSALDSVLDGALGVTISAGVNFSDGVNSGTGMDSNVGMDSNAGIDGNVGMDSSAGADSGAGADSSAGCISPVSFTFQSGFNTPQHSVTHSTPGSKRVRQVTMWDDEPWESEESIMHLLQGDDEEFLGGMEPL